jgi:hypothetical protein
MPYGTGNPHGDGNPHGHPNDVASAKAALMSRHAPWLSGDQIDALLERTGWDVQAALELVQKHKIRVFFSFESFHTKT